MHDAEPSFFPQSNNEVPLTEHRLKVVLFSSLSEQIKNCVHL